MRKPFLIFNILFFILLLAPVLSFAALTVPSLSPTGFWAPNGIVSCTGQYNVDKAVTNVSLPLTKECTSLCDLFQTFVNAIYFGMTIAIFVAAPVLFAWGGITFLVSGASPGKRDEAKKILTGTLIGLLIVLTASLLVKEFVNILGLSGSIPGLEGISCSVSPNPSTGTGSSAAPSGSNPSPGSGAAANGSACTSNSSCSSGYCKNRVCSAPPTTVGGANGNSCFMNSQCDSEYCDNSGICSPK